MPIILPSGGGSGGSQPVPATFGKAQYGGNDVAVANGATGYLTWDTLGGGTALLNLTNPGKPLVIAGAIYAVTVVANARFASFTAGGIAEAILHMDADGDDTICQQTFNAGSIDEFATVSLNNTYYIPAGGAIRVGLSNFDGVASRSFKLLEASVQVVLPDPS